MKDTTILHSDMNCFYAQRNHIRKNKYIIFFSYSKVHNGNIPQLQDWLFAQEFLTSAFVIL